MQLSNKGSWIATAAVGTATFAAALVHLVKESALRQLRKDGKLNDADQELVNTEKLLPDTPNHKLDTRPETQAAEKQWREKVKKAAQENHVDTFSGAWNYVAPQVRTKSVAFSAGAAVLVGGVTRLVTNPKSKGSSEDGDSVWDSFTSDGGGHHGHHNSGHDFGHDFGGFDLG